MKLVPPIPVIERNTQSPAEVQLARVLQRIDLHPAATAYWSVKMSGHATKQVAEADFVIVHADAFVVVEVKGGRVTHLDGQWNSTDRYGEVHRLPESPMHQARGAGWALQKHLGQDGKYFVRWDALVVTPDLPTAPRSVEWAEGRWIAGPDLSKDRMEEHLREVFSSLKPVPGHWRGGVAQTAHLKAALEATFEGDATYCGAAAILDEQNEATASQAEALARFFTHQLIVTGGAGTGKTLVMAELARREAQSHITGLAHPRVLVTFRSRSLESYVKGLLEGVEGIIVKPFADIQPDDECDVLLVDEAQDLMNADEMHVLTRALRGGLDHGRWRLFLDPNNQAHLDGLYDPETFEILSQQASALLPLDKNVRNTAPVVTTLKMMLNADLGDPGIVNGPRPSWDLASTGDLQAALRQARSLTGAGIPPSEICLIDCSSMDVDDTTSPEGFRVTSPAGIKGLEANHVVVYGWPSHLDAAGRAAAYVALTRPRVSLTVLLTPGQAQTLSDLAAKGIAHANH